MPLSEAERLAWADACNKMEWSCAGKSGFESKALADKIARKTLRSKTKKMPGTMNVYRCQYCNKWHIGGTS